jgi:hypothetical protein
MDQASDTLRHALVWDAFSVLVNHQELQARHCPQFSLTQVNSIALDTLSPNYKRFVEFVQPDEGHLIASEYWTVDRCGQTTQFRINYFQDSDHFWSAVYPTSASGWIDHARVKLGDFIRRIF